MRKERCQKGEGFACGLNRDIWDQKCANGLQKGLLVEGKKILGKLSISILLSERINREGKRGRKIVKIIVRQWQSRNGISVFRKL